MKFFLATDQYFPFAVTPHPNGASITTFAQQSLRAAIVHNLCMTCDRTSDARMLETMHNP